MHVFDIIGPIMIGPSSSHTAGASRIGLVACRLLGEDVASADIGLYGSFASTYKGHGTDRAIVAGLLGMGVDDARLRDSLRIAAEKGMAFSFHPIELKDAHPNTAVITAKGASGKSVCVEGASVGGGAIRITRLNGLVVSFTGEQDTLIVRHHDEPGMISQVSSLLAGQQVNIATMQVFRSRAGGEAVMVIETDALPTESTIACLRTMRGIQSVALLNKL